MLNSKSSSFIALNIYYGDRQRMDFYVGDDYHLPLNAQFSVTNPDDLLYIQAPLGKPSWFNDLFNLSPGAIGTHIRIVNHILIV